MVDSKSDMRRCPSCNGGEVYSRKTNANGGYGPRLLPGLGRLFKPAKMDVYVCADCGHMAFFADAEARGRVSDTFHWRRQK
ncbi:MAG: DNA-directed RNA polymerase subunit RPC12/RpoP [Chlamydiales bacterium]|jgi:DNA-directed RNA polymerase subunit RPC12/RpoP